MKNEESGSVGFCEIPVSGRVGGLIAFSFFRGDLLAIYQNESASEVETFRKAVSENCDGENCFVVAQVVDERIKIVEFHSPRIPVDDLLYLGVVHNLVSLLVENEIEDFAYTLFPSDDAFELFNDYCEQIISNKSMTVLNADGWEISGLLERCATNKGIANIVGMFSLN